MGPVLSPVGEPRRGLKVWRGLVGIAVGRGAGKPGCGTGGGGERDWVRKVVRLAKRIVVAKCETVDMLELVQRDRNDGLISKYPPTEQWLNQIRTSPLGINNLT